MPKKPCQPQGFFGIQGQKRPARRGKNTVFARKKSALLRKRVFHARKLCSFSAAERPALRISEKTASRDTGEAFLPVREIGPFRFRRGRACFRAGEIPFPMSDGREFLPDLSPQGRNPASGIIFGRIS
jgi:hypothetical protein